MASRVDGDHGRDTLLACREAARRTSVAGYTSRRLHLRVLEVLRAWAVEEKGGGVDRVAVGRVRLRVQLHAEAEAALVEVVTRDDAASVRVDRRVRAAQRRFLVLSRDWRWWKWVFGDRGGASRAGRDAMGAGSAECWRRYALSGWDLDPAVVRHRSRCDWCGRTAGVGGCLQRQRRVKIPWPAVLTTRRVPAKAAARRGVRLRRWGRLAALPAAAGDMVLTKAGRPHWAGVARRRWRRRARVALPAARDVPPDEGDSGSDQTGRVVGKDLGGATPLQLANWSWTDMGAAERQAAEGGWTKAGSKN